MKRPIIIGLTGSIGMGKSTAAKIFAGEGVAVFDADAMVHILQGPNGALVRQIEAAFPGTTGVNGVDRAALGALVLGEPDKLKQLESIIHPAIAEERARFLGAHQNDDMLVFDIPLLFEKGGAEHVDVIVVVSAPADMQKSRVLQRPGMTQDKFDSILKLQMPDAEKRSRADHVIDTGTSLEQTGANIRKLIKSLRIPLAHRQK